MSVEFKTPPLFRIWGKRRRAQRRMTGAMRRNNGSACLPRAGIITTREIKKVKREALEKVRHKAKKIRQKSRDNTKRSFRLPWRERQRRGMSPATRKSPSWLGWSNVPEARKRKAAFLLMLKR